MSDKQSEYACCTRPGAPWSLAKMRCAAGSKVVNGYFRGLSSLGRLSPRARPGRYGIVVVPDVPYTATGHPMQGLDVYIPRRTPEPRPVVLYLHGGGFRILSKDTHWLMALAFARQGFLVFNANYRLAPADPFPAAIEDVCAAYEWVIENASRWGGDASRIVVAGESAGANLATALTIATCYERPEPFAKRVFDTGVIPRAALPACGLLQASDPERFTRAKKLPGWVVDRLFTVSLSYLPSTEGDPDRYALADPVVLLERGEQPARPLPPFQAIVGTHDPIVDDTRRLGAALERMGATCETRYYAGEVHAFHAMVWRPAARRAWRDTFGFLDRTVSA